MDAALKAADEQRAAAEDAAQSAPDDLAGLSAFIRHEFDRMKRHRNKANAGWSERLLHALRVFNGQYDAQKLAEIQKFGGSTVYARIIAMKCRGASSLLRDVYLSPDRPWGIEPPDDPDVPPAIMAAIRDLVASEMGTLMMDQQAIDPSVIRDRTAQLVEAARQAAKKKAGQQAKVAEDKIDELLKEGGFYRALAEFLVDLPLFPFACIKGPVVRIVPTVTWQDGRPVTENRPRLFWNRISPFDIWWTPGASDIEDAAVIERTRLTRAELNDLLDLPGYNSEEIRAVLDEYGRGGISDDWDSTDSERADHESRENPRLNESGLITCLEYTGNVQGRMLIEYGMTTEQIPDPLRDYFVQCWLIGRHIIKVQLAPSPRKRHPYFITSFEKVPGTPVGNGLPDILNDIQEVCNASLRALVNNLSISSGPQVVVNDDRLASNEDGEELYPWKRWHTTTDPMGQSSQAPISFFQPVSNAQELLGVYQKFADMADELSAIPKYLAGSGTTGGAGRTASGLAMLMGNASKILQTVAANIDRDVLEPLLTSLFDMILLTDQSGLLTGQERVRVLGVAVAVQKETQRARQMEFLTATANPLDMQIIGPKGRAAVLRQVASGLGMDGEEIVPSQDQLEAQQRQAQQAADQQGIPGHAGVGGPAADAQASPRAPNTTQDTGPRTRIAGGP
ncbi:MAG: hemophilus-specific protein [Phenylobacterium sp.]|nr:hemophilus-specific protein [Phenylobacterium sp.]